MANCHAYNMQGQKCDLTYEHDDDHEFTIKWTNAECWTPGMEPVRIMTAATPDPEVEHLVKVPKASGRCVICSHPMHGGMCGVPDKDGFECDCAAGVEE